MTPPSLRRVYEFKFHLFDNFWTERLAASPDEVAYAAEHGERLIAVTIEEWGTHTAIRTTVAPWAAPTWSDEMSKYWAWTGRQRLPVTERVKLLYGR